MAESSPNPEEITNEVITEEKNPFEGSIGNFSAEIADMLGGDSAQKADSVVWRYVSTFVNNLYDPETNQPKYSKDQTLEFIRNALDNAPHT